MDLEDLNILHANMKGSIGERLHIIPADSDPLLWDMYAKVLERADILEKLRRIWMHMSLGWNNMWLKWRKL